MKNFACYSSALSPATSKSAPSVVDWTGERLEAFQHLKGCLVDVCILTVPCLQDLFVLHTDASGAGIGATLNVIRNGQEKPVAYFSRQLQGAQKHYSATELEGLAVFKAIHFFSHFLYGRKFDVITDHQALVSLLKSRILNRRLHGWVLQLLDYDFSISYRPGKDNADADCLSRQAWESQEGDPWRPADSLEEQKESRKESRTTGQILLVGGDVGTEPHIKKKREQEEKEKEKDKDKEEEHSRTDSLD